MDNEAFYVAAVTVIPLLLIAVMATRSLRVGEFSSQPRITVLIFGLPVLGELGAFAYLFFEPVPTAAAVILALVTWAGLLSQLGVAVWWCTELIRHPEVQQPVPSNGGALEVRHRSRRSFCPTCGAPLLEGSTFCESCGTAAPAMFGDSTPETPFHAGVRRPSGFCYASVITRERGVCAAREERRGAGTGTRR